MIFIVIIVMYVQGGFIEQSELIYFGNTLECQSYVGKEVTDFYETGHFTGVEGYCVVLPDIREL